MLYLPSWRGGFQQDFQGWLQLYHDNSFWQILNRKDIPVHSFYQLTQLQLYVLTSLFGIYPVPWFLIFTALHAFSGTTLFFLSKAVFSDFGLPRVHWIAATGTLLVLVNPSMSEVVVWKAAYHYHIAILGVLWSLIWARQFLVTGQTKWIVRIIILVLLLAFTLEIWYTIPVLIFILALAYKRAGIIDHPRYLDALKRLIAPQVGVLILHLIAFRLVYHQWLAHSSYTSAGDDNLFILAGRIWTYEWHLLGFGRFFPYSIRSIFYDYLGGYWGGVLAIAILATGIEWTWRSYPRMSASARVAMLLFAWSLVSLALVLQFIPPDIMLVVNDRYLYFTAFFQWMLVALLITRLFRSNIFFQRTAFALLFGLCVSFTAFVSLKWHRSTKVFWSLQDKFIWRDAPVVLILNMPCNYKGIGIITGSDTSELSNHLRVFGKGAPKGLVYDVSSYNMVNYWDGAHVVVEDSTHLHVTLNQWGSWWQLHNLGALDRSTPLFDLHFIDGGHDYMLTLKQHPPGMVILFQQGQEWRVVDMNKIGIEQK